MCDAWRGFKQGNWMTAVDVRNFIQRNVTPYTGDKSFLQGPTARTRAVWSRCDTLLQEELKRGVLAVDTERISGIGSFGPGYIDRENEVIVGLQTDEPLKRMMNPYGGLGMVETALKAYGYEVPPGLHETFTRHRKTHNQGVFDAYTDEMRRARSAGLLTGLPDAYGRGRIIGDYRRIALYGLATLIEEKKRDLARMRQGLSDSVIRLREEVTEQIRALEAIGELGTSYGLNLFEPARTGREAVQNLYMGYLAGVKENNGAAMSLGRVSTFLDIYLERDIQAGILDEVGAQELIDQLVIKLRLVRHLRTPEYNQLFAGDPNWVTEAIGGIAANGKTLVTRTSFRFLHTLTNLGPAPEPNMTVLWSERLPDGFKKYCAEMSNATDSIQYENDELMRPVYGDDYGIACCVSAMGMGKEMQYFGARCNLAKTLLYAINGGVDEMTGKRVLEDMTPMTEDVLEFDTLWARFEEALERVAALYVDTMNVIHHMHDRYAYEASLMALHDTNPRALMAFGAAGLSIVADSFSAVRYARVRVIRENGIATGFEVDGEYPMYGNDDDRVDDLAVRVAELFIGKLRRHRAYRGARHTLSILTITSNIVYGRKTGATPCGRDAGEAFAPGANAMHGREHNGALAALNTVAKLPYRGVCEDGISNTFTVVPEALGKEAEDRSRNLVHILDGYFGQGGHHINVNVLSRETLMDAMEHPERYPNLTIRVSGYAVHFVRLTREQQLEVLKRTYHTLM